MYLARFDFLKSVVKFYYQACQSINLNNQLNQEPRLAIEKAKENFPVILSELDKIVKTEILEEETENVEELRENIHRLLSWIDRAHEYRQYKEKFRGLVSIFRPLPKPELGDFLEKPTQQERQALDPSHSTG